MPVIVGHGLLLDWRGVQDHIVRRVLKNGIHAPKQSTEHGRQIVNLGVRHILRMGVVGLWNDPGLKRRARGVGSENHEMVGLLDKAESGIALLRKNVAVYASLLVIEVLACPVNFLLDSFGHNRQRNQLGVRMLQHRAGSFAVVLAQE